MFKLFYLCIVALFNLGIGYALAVYLRRGLLPWELGLRQLVGPWSAAVDANVNDRAPQAEPSPSEVSADASPDE